MPNISAGRIGRRGSTGIAVLALALFAACSDLLTSAPEAGDVFDGPVDGLSGAELAVIRQETEATAARFGYVGSAR